MRFHAGMALIFALLLGFGQAAWGAPHGTLEAVKARGYLVCGTVDDGPGMATRDGNGELIGFLPSFCRALAAAVLGSAEMTEFKFLDAKTWFEAVRAGDVDVLVAPTTWTLGRESGQGLTFPGILYYDGQGFLAHKSLGAKRLADIPTASICVQENTTSHANLDDLMQRHPGLKIVPHQTGHGRWESFYARRCDVITTDRLLLSAERAVRSNPQDYVMLDDIVSREPIGPVVKNNDSGWATLVRWVINALVLAEQKGITSANVESMTTSANAETRRMLGVDGGFGGLLGVSDDWALQAIRQVGNYREIYDRHLGANSSLGLPRGVNAPWTEGGLMYSPPFR